MPLTEDEEGTIGCIVGVVWVAILAAWVAAMWRVAGVLGWPWLIVTLPASGLAVLFAGGVIAMKVGAALEAAVERRRKPEDSDSEP